MKKIIRLDESKLIDLIKDILNEQDENVIRMSASEYVDLLGKVGYNPKGINVVPKHRGKEIIVVGDVNLRGNKKVIGLGNIKIEGKLDVSSTNIKNLDGVEVTGYISHWSTPYQDHLDRIEKQNKYNEMAELREEDAWNIDNTDETSEKANAAFRYCTNQGYLESLSEDEIEEIQTLKQRIADLEEQQENLNPEDADYSEKFDEITDQQSKLEDEIDEIISEKVDVYDLYPHSYGFESLSTGIEITVYTEDEADQALEDYYQEMVDDADNYFDYNRLSYHIDGDAVAEYFEDSIREWILDDPDSYNIEKQLSDEQEEEIWLLEMEKWVYENEGVRAPIQNQTKEDGDVFDFEDSDDNRFQYKKDGNGWVLYKDGTIVSPHQIYEDEDTEEHQEARDERISDIEYEIEEIKENPEGEPDDDAIEEEVEDRLYEIKRNPEGFLEEYGYDKRFIVDNFIDKDSLLESLTRDGDYGNLNGYDGRYDDIKINDTWYVVMRTN